MAVTAITAAEIVAQTAYAYAGRRQSATAHLAAVEALLPMATSLTETYAPEAPTGVKNVAMVRLIGWFLEGRFGSFQSNQVKVPSQSHSVFFRNSGAQAMLSPYKRRRAAAI